MRTLLLILLILPAFRSAAQVAATDPLIAKANASFAAIAAATTDAQRDSLNMILKHDLRLLFAGANGESITLDSLKISNVEAPDKSFRLITWNLPRQNGSHHFEGLLLHSKNGKKNLHELRDATSSIASPEVPELSTDQWYGALYYEVIPVKKGGKTYYTLLGWKGADRVETRKVIDVLHFKGGTPKFGSPIFGSGKLKRNRKVFNYSFHSTMTLRYEPEYSGIVMDHLSPSRPDLEGQFAFYGPDMSYDAYVWEKDHWKFERDIDARDRSRSGKPFNAPPPAPRP